MPRRTGGFANSTSSCSIIVAKSAVIMLDILIRGCSKEKLDPASSSFASLSSPISLLRSLLRQRVPDISDAGRVG